MGLLEWIFKKRKKGELHSKKVETVPQEDVGIPNGEV